MEFFVEFFVMTDIAIHQLNLGPFKILEFLVENSFIQCVFYTCITINAQQVGGTQDHNN